jgi:hypothetical protein
MKALSAILLSAALASSGRAAVIFWEELPYFSAEDSPFYAGIRAGTIYLEDFEDHELNTPYVISWDSPRIVGEINGVPIPSRQRGQAEWHELKRVSRRPSPLPCGFGALAIADGCS